MTEQTLKLYWSASKPNVGDWLSPMIVGAMTDREVVHAPAKRCDMMAVGSILQKAKNHWWSPAVDVWGSGFIQDCKPVQLKHRVHAVRGKHTRDRIVGGQSLALGDPGILVSRVLPALASAQRPVKVGVVPHYWDRGDPSVSAFIERLPGAVFLDIFNDVDTFIRDMNQCQCILSSSLHGLVMADSYGIPNQWLVLSDKVEGNNYKFGDYYSVFDMECPRFTSLDAVGEAQIEHIVANYRRPGLIEVMDEISAAFPAAWK